MRCALPLLALVSLAFAPAPVNPVKADLAAIQGRWAVVAIVEESGPVEGDDLKGRVMEFAGENVSFSRGKEVESRGKFSLDTAGRPRGINFRYEGGKKPALGIYELDGDALRLCFDRSGRDRPKLFDVPKGSSAFSLTLRRVAR